MIKGLFPKIGRILFPNDCTCELCGEETFSARLCEDCERTIFHNDGIVCPVCGRRTEKREICRDCKQRIPLFKRGVSALVYEGGAIPLIAAYKQGKSHLYSYFGELMLPFVAALPEFDGIVYVPLTKKRKSERGYNQSKLLADFIGENTGKPVLDILEKIKDTSEQKSLSGAERMENLNGCFAVSDKGLCKGKKLLLIDDVLTTGATANAVTKVLLRAGAKEIYYACAASTEYKPRIPIKPVKWI